MDKKPQLRFLLPVIVATAACILSWIGCVIRCQFITFKDTSGKMSIQFGIFYHQSFRFAGNMIYGSCIQYPDYVNIDPSWKAARIFSVLALIFGTAFLLIVMAATCFRPNQAKSIIGPGFFLTAMFQGLSLLFLNSDACKNNSMMNELQDHLYPVEGFTFQETCSISTGAKCIISAMALYFVASFMSCIARAFEHENEHHETTRESLLDPFLDGASIFSMPPNQASEISGRPSIM